MAERAGMRIAYAPFTNAHNAYVPRMHEILGRFGHVERFMRPRQFLDEVKRGRGRFQRYDATVFNWIENEFVDEATGTLPAINIVKVFLKTLVARLLSRRLILVRHNTYPHTVKLGHERAAEALVDRYERMFHVVFSHSGAHLEGKRLYCPHPLYWQEKQSADVSDSSILSELPGDYFVVFGRIAPYKQVIEMIRGFPAERQLVIIGSVTDKAYGAEVAEAAQRPNVLYRPGYLTDAQAQRIITGSQGIVMAHAGDNTVVSGSFFFAMSLPVPVLAVETPFLNWVAPRVGPELLVVRPDLPALLEAARDYRRPAALEQFLPRLQQLFGDDAVAEALRPGLGIAS